MNPDHERMERGVRPAIEKTESAMPSGYAEADSAASEAGLPVADAGFGTVASPDADPLPWVPCHGKWKKGPENGWVIEDEEIPSVCRITLEEDCDAAPYAITCGVYGLMVHTTWDDDYGDAMEKYEAMKKDLRQCAEMLDGEGFSAGGWCDDFASKW